MKLLDLAGERRWCAWRTEFRGPKNEPTKVPYGAGWAPWKSNDPSTWVTRAEAQSLGAGVGVALGPLGDGRILAGIDYDSCIGAEVAQWALEAIHSAGGGHVEVSPSGAGLKQFLLVSERLANDVAAGLFGTSGKRGGTVEKKPNPDGGKAVGIEAYLGLRFFTVTDDLLFGTDDLAELTVAGAEGVRQAGLLIPSPAALSPDKGGLTNASLWMSTTGEASEIVARVAAAAQLRPVIAALLGGDTSVLGRDQSDSQVAAAISGQLMDAGWSTEECFTVLSIHPLENLVRWRTKHIGQGTWMREASRTLGHDNWSPARGESKALGPIEPQIIEGVIIEDNESWKNLLQTTRGKNPEYRGNLNNARIALLEAPALKGMLAFNEFSDRIVVKRCPPYEKASDWTGPRDYADRDCIQIAAWLQAEAVQIEPAKVLDASVAVSWEFRYDPVRAYLEAVEQAWDGVGRLNLWMNEYLGVLPSTYTQATAAMSLIGSVARVFEPGCQKDTLTLLEGVQGIYKSSALITLYGQEYFVDHIPVDISGKDALMQLAGKWCVEHAEMDRLSKAEASKVKAFLSTRIDIYRRPYGRVTQPVPRRCVFWGTINPNNRGYLTDETGNRRFWPVKCADKPINLKGLRDVRDQLWAEATRRYLRGELWYMTGQAQRQQEAQVARRFDEDVWTSKVKQFLTPLESVSIAEVLRNGLGVTDDKHTIPAQNRVARILRAIGLERKQVRRGPFREWRFVKQGKPAKSNIIPFRQSGDSGDTQ